MKPVLINETNCDTINCDTQFFKKIRENFLNEKLSF